MAVVSASEVAILGLLIAGHAYANGSCAAAGISTAAGREGTCVRYSEFLGAKTVYNVVDAGHVLDMPGYDPQLLATNVAPTRVSNPESDPSAYPNGEGLLVSFEIAVTNQTDGLLLFDQQGRDVDLLINNLDTSSPEISFPDLPTSRTRGEPGTSIADSGAIAPHSTVTGWVNFVAPIWTRQVLNQRAADLEFHRAGNLAGYIGQIRLWKAANPQGQPPSSNNSRATMGPLRSQDAIWARSDRRPRLRGVSTAARACRSASRRSLERAWRGRSRRGLVLRRTRLP